MDKNGSYIDLVDKFVEDVPPQHQDVQPGVEENMNPLPIYEMEGYDYSCNRLKGKVAIITGGDSGIGRAVSIAFAREGAKVVISYLNEDDDAMKTQSIIQEKNGECMLISGDICEEEFCNQIIDKTIEKFGRLDILVNNAAVQYPQKSIEFITKEQLEKTFKTNLFSAVYLSKAAIKYMEPGSSIINTTSVVSYKGHETLIDYSMTKGALTTFTRSLGKSLAEKGIRVNAVAPGPVWTPLIPASFDKTTVGNFDEKRMLGRIAQPVELAESYVFLASQGASYITGTTIHVNGGIMVTD